MTRNNIATALDLAKEHLTNKKLKNKQYYDEKTSDLDVKVNDLILVRAQKKKHKFADVYDGPFKVVDCSDSHVEIKRGNRRVKIHKNLIKKAQADYDDNTITNTPFLDLDDLDEESINRLDLIYNINFDCCNKYVET